MDMLKPCPFCGSPNIKDSTDAWGKVYYQCRECKARGPTRTVTLRNPWADDVAWNFRADLPPTLEAALALPEIAALAEAAKQLHADLLIRAEMGRVPAGRTAWFDFDNALTAIAQEKQG